MYNKTKDKEIADGTYISREHRRKKLNNAHAPKQ